MGIQPLCFGDFHFGAANESYPAAGPGPGMQRSEKHLDETRGRQRQQRAESRSPLYASPLAPSALEHLT
jgi:hypothetical protein